MQTRADELRALFERFPEGGVIQASELGWRFEGIFYDPDTPEAVINGKNYGRGAEIGGVKIAEIHPSDLVVQFEGRRLTVRY